MKWRRVVVRTLLAGLWAVSLFTLVYPARAQAQGGGGGIHVVARGETLSQIARAYGTDVGSLLALNDLPNANLVYVGQQLIVPGGSGTAANWNQSGWDAPNNGPQQSGSQVMMPANQRQGMAWDPQNSGGPVQDGPGGDGAWQNGPYQYAGVGWEPEAAQARDGSRTDGGRTDGGRTSAQPNWDTQPSDAADTRWEQPARDETHSPYLEEWEGVHTASNAYKPGTSWEPEQNVEPGRGAEYSGEKWIDIDLSDQVLIAYQGDDAVRYFSISSGSATYPTVTGSFRTYSRTELQDMSGGSRADGTYYFQPDVPWVQYFFESYAIHGAYWHNMFGTPIGHGCINMRVEDSHWLYEWTGTTGIRVEVHQ